MRPTEDDGRFGADGIVPKPPESPDAGPVPGGSILSVHDRPSEAESDPRLVAWRFLAGDDAKALCADAAELVDSGIDPAGVARLRRRHPGRPTLQAIELADARRRGRGKFPGIDRLLVDRQGIEQASSEVVARWKAARFAEAPVLDLCCGIGGDTMALAARGPCTGVDLDPVRGFMAARNAGVEVRIESVESTRLDHPLVHLDPARRDESSGRRRWRLEDLSPPLDRIKGIVGQVEGAAVKLGPGLPRPFARLHDRQSISIVAEGGRLVQAVIWTGSLARERELEAVDLPSGRSFEGSAGSLPVGGLERLSVEQAARSAIVTFHPAIERAELGPSVWAATVGEARIEEPSAGLGLALVDLDAVRDSNLGGGWWRATRIHRVLPMQLESVAAAISEMRADGPLDGPARIEVRTRGAAIDTDAWTRRLAGLVDASAAPGAFVRTIEVHGLRIGRRTLATVGESIVPSVAGGDQPSPSSP